MKLELRVARVRVVHFILEKDRERRGLKRKTEASLQNRNNEHGLFPVPNRNLMNNSKHESNVN